MMELKDFITEAIKQIAEGSLAGHRHLHGAKIGKVHARQAIDVNFDVAVTTMNELEKSGDAKISVISMFSAAGHVVDTSSTANHSRISFVVKVDLDQPSFNSEAPRGARISISNQ